MFSPASRIRMPRPPQNSTTFISELSWKEFLHLLDGRYGGLPPQCRIEPPVGQMRLDALQSNVLPEHVRRETVSRELRVQFLDARAHRPFGLEARNVLAQLVAVDAIASRVWAAALHVLHAAIGHDLLNDVCDIPNLIVLRRAPDVERLVVNGVAW